MNKILITTAAVTLLAISPALAHNKKEKHVKCLVNQVYDAENNVCLTLLLDDEYAALTGSNTDTVVEENDLDWPGNSDEHRQDKDRAQRTGNNGRGTTDALDRGDPPGKGNTKNDTN